MTYLKFYRKEKELFSDATDTKISDKNVLKFSHKIARHFKVKLDTVKIKGYRGSGSASRVFNAIRLSHNPSVLLIIHELGHLYTRQKLNESKHNKNLMRFISKGVKYAQKNGYWNMQQTETEKTQQQIERIKRTNNKKRLIAFTQCGKCKHVMNWRLSNINNIRWYKEHYAVNTVHDITCPKCEIRNAHKIIEQKYLTDSETQELLAKLNAQNHIISFTEITVIEDLNVKGV